MIDLTISHLQKYEAVPIASLSNRQKISCAEYLSTQALVCTMLITQEQALIIACRFDYQLARATWTDRRTICTPLQTQLQVKHARLT